MSQENVELVRALYPPTGTDLVPLFRDEDAFAGVREIVSPFLAPEFECEFVFPGQVRTYKGLEGLRKNWLDWLEPWAAYRTGIEDLIDAGDRVVVLDRDHARREDIDEEVEMVGATVLTFKEGKVARWAFYADRRKALEAVGLSE